MTARELYEYALIELNKLEAPSLLLEDYNYFINKAIQQYINLTYAKLEIDQQSTDDIRVLKASVILKPNKNNWGYSDSQYGLFKTNWNAELPSDYMHLLNCIVEYKVQTSNFKCYNKGDVVYFPARRLTSGMYTQIINNAYLTPMYKRPYYYIRSLDMVTLDEGRNSEDKAILDYNNGHTDKGTAITHGENWETEAEKYKSSNLVDAENTAGDRLSNPSKVIIDIRFGKDDGVFMPNNLYIDYIKSPMYIRLTQDQINSTLDYSQILEFPDYVCFEIANIFTRLLMENASDPRLNTNMPINQTIASPAAQQQAKSK